ncbi:MAG: hypothetical protein MR867_02280 [Eubacterium sp.]|nr:hypothetical protein [Eubacterium sp.]MDD7210304.1 hypothetical protein [Lachnospiraceae bacterium]MDY5496858.1 hypothetical protein [Anaerobutyricum sp.]
MKTEYLRHEYTWSNHCITGNRLGWGITASSLPEKKEYLRELEKFAQAAVTDKSGKVEVEELVYSSVCGYVKMISSLSVSGDDRRQNKRVRLFQAKASDKNPSVYLSARGNWESQETGVFLSPVYQETCLYDGSKIIEKWNLENRLSDLMRAVFWCLSDNAEGLDIVASSWEEKDFAQNSGEIMYLIHSFLPECLRQKAGYVSFTREGLPSVPFYFSKEACSPFFFDLEKGMDSREEDEMDHYFFGGFSKHFSMQDDCFRKFMDEAQTYLNTMGNSGNLLNKLEWVYYYVAVKFGEEHLSFPELCKRLPELLYWEAKDRYFSKIAEFVLGEIRERKLNGNEERLYVKSLVAGVTGRSKPRIVSELDKILEKIRKEDPKLLGGILPEICESNRELYTMLVCRFYSKEDCFFGKELFAEKSKSMNTLSEYVENLSEKEIPSGMKDHILRTGIRLLNQNLFDKKQYELFDHMAVHLNREGQWVRILKDFVGQLEEHVKSFNEEQLDTACFVEELLGSHCGSGAGTVLRDERGRHEKVER